MKKRAHLLTLGDAKTYDTVCALLQPLTPDQVDYADIVAALQTHFKTQRTSLRVALVHNSFITKASWMYFG